MEWLSVIGAAVLIAALYEWEPRVGGPFLVLVVLVMLARASQKGYL